MDDSANNTGLHPQWEDPAHLAALVETWNSTGMLQLTPALSPGLCATLSSFLRQLPFEVHMDSTEGRTGLCWACTVGVPDSQDPQIPSALYATCTAVDSGLPQLVRQVTGRPWVSATPRHLTVRSLRKGSWLTRAASSAGTIDWILGLTGDQWPASSGGYVAIGEREPGPMGWNELTLISAHTAIEITLLAEHFEGLLIWGRLTEAREC